MARWYLQVPGSAPAGPFETADVRARFAAGHVPNGSLVREEDAAGWTPYHQLAALAGPTKTATSGKAARNIALVVVGVGVIAAAAVGVLGVRWYSQRLTGPLEWCNALAVSGTVENCTEKDGSFPGTRSAEFSVVRDKSWGAVTVFDDSDQFEDTWRTARTWPGEGTGPRIANQLSYMSRGLRVMVTLKNQPSGKDEDSITTMLSLSTRETLAGQKDHAK